VREFEKIMEDEKDRCDVAKLEGRIKTPF